MSSTQSKLVYEEVVAGYWESLATVLRGFVPATSFPFLETWVHDEDDASSILNILDAASGAGLSSVTIVVGQATLERMDQGRLREEAAKLGRVREEARDGGLELEVTFRTAPVALHVSPAYRANLASVLKSCSHERGLGTADERPEEGLVLANATREGITLSALIDPKQHVITRAAHRGGRSAVERGIMEGLCQEIEGTPILEAADHGVLRLEHRLRDPLMPRPVPGVVMPENADPALALPLALVRDLLRDYRRQAGYRETLSEYEPAVSAAWMRLSEGEAMERIRRALAANLLGDGVAVVGLEHGRRVTLRFGQGVDAKNQQGRAMAIERLLQDSLEPSLEVLLEPKQDALSIRLKNGARS